MDSRKLTVEFLGTFILIFIGAGSAVLASAGMGNIVSVALAFGLVVLGLAYAYGDISGLHINPAITFGMLVSGKIDPIETVAYWVAQLLGGIVGAATLYFVIDGFVNVGELGLGNTLLGPDVGILQGLVMEIFLTFLLTGAVLHGNKAGNMAPVAIGLTLTVCVIVGGPVTGGSLNPARTLGPALMTGIYDHFWLYVVGPLAGAGLAAALHGYLRGSE